MPSPIGNQAPLCGARSKRSGKGCLNRAMPNGRCRMHGGTSTGPPLGSHNAITHGIYSDAVTADEHAVWDRIPIEDVDDEIRILKLRLARVLRLQEKHDAEPENTKLLELTKSSTSSEHGGQGVKQSAAVERTRPDFHRLILAYTRRIAEVMNTRRILRDGGDGPRQNVQFIIANG